MYSSQRWLVSLALLFFIALPGSAAVGNETLKITCTDPATGVPVDISLYRRMYAVVIGIDRYPKLPLTKQLRYAVKDARAITSLLREKYAFTDVIELYNDSATAQNIRRVLLDQLGSLVGESDAVFIFFAGHGFKRVTPFCDIGLFVPYDGDLDEVSSNLSMDFFQTEVASTLAARHIFFVFDACYSGLAARRSVSPEGQRTPPRNPLYLQSATNEYVRQVLAAATSEQEILDDGGKGHSLFTGRMLEKLGATNDFLTARELSFWLEEVVSSDAARRGLQQTPMSDRLEGKGDFVFVPRPAAEPQTATALRLKPGRVIPLVDTTPPRIHLDVIPKNSLQPEMTISGRVTDDAGKATLDADGQKISLELDGRFSVIFSLGEGINEIMFTARDKTGNETTVTLAIRYSSAAGVSHILECNPLMLTALTRGSSVDLDLKRIEVTDTITKIMRRRQARLQTIMKLKAKGLFGEANSGLMATPEEIHAAEPVVSDVQPSKLHPGRLIREQVEANDAIGPSIALDNEAFAATSEEIVVSGRVHDENGVLQLLADDIPIEVAPSGHFSVVYRLRPGSNIVTLTARDRFDNSTIKRMTYRLGSDLASRTMFSLDEQHLVDAENQDRLELFKEVARQRHLIWSENIERIGGTFATVQKSLALSGTWVQTTAGTWEHIK